MRIRVLPVLVVLLLTGLFALINWSAFTTPTMLNLGVTMVSAPLGLVMLGVLVLLGVMYIGSVVALQGVALLESRRMSKEVQTQRDLADKAEASRFTELREFMSAEMARMQRLHDEMRAAMMTRMDEMERRSRTVMEDTANSLSSYIGELEDRLDHRLPPGDGGVARGPDYRPPPR
ncbi:MAG: LapA family protein [Pseudomonadota bacterium]